MGFFSGITDTFKKVVEPVKKIVKDPVKANPISITNDLINSTKPGRQLFGIADQVSGGKAVLLDKASKGDLGAAQQLGQIVARSQTGGGVGMDLDFSSGFQDLFDQGLNFAGSKLFGRELEPSRGPVQTAAPPQQRSSGIDPKIALYAGGGLVAVLVLVLAFRR